jgi:hypothetical protein
MDWRVTMAQRREGTTGVDLLAERRGAHVLGLGHRLVVGLGATALLVMLAACSTPTGGGPSAFTPIASTFDTDTEGWTSSEPLDPSWAAPGYLSLVDGGPSWYYAIAPGRFHGDWTGASSVSFDVLADADGVLFPVRVVVSGAGANLYHEFPLSALEAGAWRALSVPLTVGAWRAFAGEEVEGDVVDAETFAAVVASVDDFRIRVDLNSKSEGDEFNGLDDVVVE